MQVIEKKLVLVVGAGASKEVGLPTGEELKGIIRDLLDIRFDYRNQVSGDGLISQTLREYSAGSQGAVLPKEIIAEAWHIRDTIDLAPSIDNLIHDNRGNKLLELCGKIAIIRAILIAESNSSIYFRNEGNQSAINYAQLIDSWYVKFFRIIKNGCSKEDLKSKLSKIAIISFNYDRCIEHFLFNSLVDYYRLSTDEAASLIECIEIIHPYGSVGELPWMGSSLSIGYGAGVSSRGLLTLTNRIKTFTEGVGSDEISKCRGLVFGARKIAFLGFAFHGLNMDILRSDEERKAYKTLCYASTFGISDSDMEVVSSSISSLYKNMEVQRTKALRCGDFFDEYSRSLSL